MIERGDVEIGKQLIANSFVHDQSKFYGIEWEYLNEHTKENDKEKFLIALRQHQMTNKHHPEYWGGLEVMDRVSLYEMITDLRSRSIEQSTDLKDYIRKTASSRWKISNRSKLYKHIMSTIDLLIEKPFTKV